MTRAPIQHPLKKLKTINSRLHLQIIEENNCKGAGERLAQVMLWMKENGHTKILLREFAHSASCKLDLCSPFCKMLRRVRNHVVRAQHRCVLLRLYALMLRLHVNGCSTMFCGLPACPILKARKITGNIRNSLVPREVMVSNASVFRQPTISSNPLVTILPVRRNKLKTIWQPRPNE